MAARRDATVHHVRQTGPETRSVLRGAHPSCLGARRPAEVRLVNCAAALAGLASKPRDDAADALFRELVSRATGREMPKR